MSIKLSREIAKAENVLYDPSEHLIKAITVAGPDVRLILFEDIEKIGQDAIMIDTDTAIKNLSQVNNELQRMVRENLYLTDTTVMTEDGVNLGKIADFTFDTTTGEVLELEISKGALEDIKSGRKRVPGSTIQRIGQNMTIVKGDVDDKLASEPVGGLQGMLGGIQKKVSDTQKKISPKD